MPPAAHRRSIYQRHVAFAPASAKVEGAESEEDEDRNGVVGGGRDGGSCRPMCDTCMGVHSTIRRAAETADLGGSLGSGCKILHAELSTGL